MFCPNCGAKLNDNEKFCKYCGTSVSTDAKQESQDVTNSNITEEDFIKSFVGNHYEKIVHNNFSIPTFFFSFFYTLYRKMWLYSLLWFVFNCLVKVIFDKYTSALVSLFVHALIAVNFSKIYLNFAKMKVQKLKEKNSSMTDTELLDLCKRKGNTSILALITTIIIIVTITSIAIWFWFLAIEEFFMNTKFEQDYLNTNLLQYDIPSGFSSENEYLQEYQRFSYTSSTDYCTIQIKMKKNYQNKTLDDYFKSSIYSSINDKVSDITSKQINGTNWNSVSVSNSKNIRYYLATIKNSDIYEIEYSVYQDETKYCSNNYEKFINSLDFTNTNKDFNSI